ncbi:hypothetical protein FO519_003299, partial [Halicephalobus sp. NKZ332]
TTFGFQADLFLGIPYAKAPIGDLRFEKPLPPEKWDKPFLAKSFGSRCATYPIYDINEKEDCLTLNIMRPTKISNPEGYPVMVFIHGGDFITGSSADYSYQAIVENLVSRAVIFVSINYRLGPFGFYSTGNDFAQGNYGLWDQVQALKFVKEVIPSFGGNPDKITVFGESAGGASVSWLTLSPESEGLFSNAIMMSGSAQSVWANGDVTVESSKKINKILGCDKVEDLKKCLQRASTKEILDATKTFVPAGVLRVDDPRFSFFHPRIDGDFVDGVDFNDLIKKAPKRKHLIGLDSQEDISFALDRSPSNSSKFLPLPYYKIKNFRESDFVNAIQSILGTEDAYGEKHELASKKIIDFYGNNKNYRKNFFLQTYVQIFSDIHFNVPAIREAKQKSEHGHEVYIYKYSFVPEEYADPLVEGARHGAELANLYNMPRKEESEATLKTQKTFIDLFVSFAKYGKPVTSDFEVPQVKGGKAPFVDVKPNSEIGNDLWPDRVGFWDRQQQFGFDWPSGLES